MRIDRRGFTTQLAAVSATLSLAAQGSAQSDTNIPLFVATWNFGLPACKKSLEVLKQTGSLLDAIERGINVAEGDPNVDSVGVGGAPNSAGVVQLDACFMNGADHRAGAVAGLENFAHPVSVARRVMEKTKHVMLVGEGAAAFARQQDFEPTNLLTDVQKKKWQEWLAKTKGRNDTPPSHDTISLVGLDANGNLAGGCSTSGLAYKLPGRVGDSPILGSGLYVDGDVGAAGATGIGENVMRYCGSFLIVEFMRSGMEPSIACKAAIDRIAKHERRAPSDLHINFLAIDKKGRWGGAGTDKEFEIAVVTPQMAELRKPELV